MSLLSNEAWLSDEQVRRLKNKLRRLDGEDYDGAFIESRENNSVVVGQLYKREKEDQEE